MDPAAPLLLLEALAADLPESAIGLALARRRAALDAQLENARRSPGWDAATALRHAHLWLVAGMPGRGDDLVLEADQLAPEAGLIPDWWALWPQPNPADAGGQQEAVRLAQTYLTLRHLPPVELWLAWLQAVQADRARIDEPALRLLLGLVINGREQLPGPLEPALEQLVGEELVTAEPALCWRFFDALSDRLPQWGYARLKAADLSLQRGELQRCRELLDGASDGQWQLAWLHDVAARLALAQGGVAEALAAWQRAIERSTSDADLGHASVAELFRQRAREARRGPGVLEARSLLNRGEQAAAVALLEALLQQDPQWQPLRSLLEQARQGDRQAAAPPPADVQRLDSRLQDLALRAGLDWPPALQEQPADAAGFERFLQQALGRLALLG